MRVIIPSKNINNLVHCIRVIGLMDPGCKIIVVNDGIPEKDLERLGPLADIGDIWVIPGISPFIFARNVNLGIQCAGREDVVILNDDALLVSPKGFTILELAATGNPSYGLIGAVTEHTGNVNQWPKGEGLREDPRMVCFVCVYISRATIDAIGTLDEDFTGYGYDDDDYCFRVRAAGKRIGIHDWCEVDHGRLQSTFRASPLAQCDMSINHAVFMRKHGSLNPQVPRNCEIG